MFRTSLVVRGAVDSLRVVAPADPHRCAVVGAEGVIAVEPSTGAMRTLCTGRAIESVTRDLSLGVTPARELVDLASGASRGTLPMPGAADGYWLSSDGARLLVRERRSSGTAPEGWLYRLLETSTARTLGEHFDPAYGWVTPDQEHRRFAIRSSGTTLWDATTGASERLPIGKSAYPYFSADLKTARWCANASADRKRGSEQTLVRSWIEGQRRARSVVLDTAEGATVTRYWFATRDGHLAANLLFLQEWHRGRGDPRDGGELSLAAFATDDGKVRMRAPVDARWRICADGTLPGVVAAPSGDWAALTLSFHEALHAPPSRARLAVLHLVPPTASGLRDIPTTGETTAMHLAPVAARDDWLAAVDVDPARAADAVVFFVRERG